MMQILNAAHQRLNAVLQDQAAVDLIDRTAKNITIGSSGAGMVIGGLSISDWAAIISAGVAVCGLVFHIWFTMKYKRNKE